MPCTRPLYGQAPSVIQPAWYRLRRVIAALPVLGEAQAGAWSDHQTNYRTLNEIDFSHNHAFKLSASF
jgi:hypothetical protein